MPSREWNRKWENMILDFKSSDQEAYFGDRWGDPESFSPLLAVREKFIEPYIAPGQHLLEIGPGGGRMTQYLLAAKHITLVDLNVAVFDYLKGRFPADTDKFTFYQTTGYEMQGIGGESIDLVFTFDCFVHVDLEDILGYLHEIERVLKPQAKAVIHYGDINKDIARENPGFTRNTQAQMQQLIQQTKLAELAHDTEVMFHSNLVVLQKP